MREGASAPIWASYQKIRFVEVIGAYGSHRGWRLEAYAYVRKEHWPRLIKFWIGPEKLHDRSRHTYRQIYPCITLALVEDPNAQQA